MCKLLTGLTLISIMFISGCSDKKVGSSSLPTNAIYAEMYITQFHDGEVTVQARLRTGSINSNTYVKLQNGDSLITSVGRPVTEVTITNDLFGNLGSISNDFRQLHGGPDLDLLDILYPFLSDYSEFYWTQLPYTDTSQPVLIGFYRQAYNNALNSQASLPPVFSINSPASNSSHVMGGDLQINWDNAGSGYATRIVIEAECENNNWQQEYNISPGNDLGYTTIAANDLYPIGAIGVCVVTISIDRSLVGSLDPQYAGGSISAHQSRSITISVQ